MGSIKVSVTDEVEKRFREVAMKRFGYHKGSLSLAAERAFDDFYKSSKAFEGVKVRPLGEVLSGVLSHVKNKTSVELQHEASKIRAELAMKGVSRRKRVS